MAGLLEASGSRSEPSSLRMDAPSTGKTMSLAILVHCLLWSVIPALVIGNLHADTLEAIYWGSDWALGYGKHPPIATWLLDGAVSLRVAPIFCVLALSQATVAIAAYFIWKTIRIYQGPSTAALGALLFIASPAATFYAVQANHNSFLQPFCAACAYFGLAWLEERRVRDAVLLGVAAGFGLVTKYEILFILAVLVVMAASIPRFRWAFAQPASYLSIVVMAAIAAPHVWWLAHHGWPSVDRALGVEKVTSIDTLNLSAVNALIGQFTLFALPGLVLLSVNGLRVEGDFPPPRVGARIGAALAVGPSLVLLAGAAATYQVIKPLWVLPLASCAAVGLALLFPAEELGRARSYARATLVASALVLACFFAYLFASDAIGRPVTAYEPRAHVLAKAVASEWSRYQTTPLACLVIADRKLGPSPLLWIKPLPKVVDYSSAFWHKPEQIAACKKSGAVIVDTTPNHQARLSFAPACDRDRHVVEVPAAFGLRKATWPVELSYVPPAGQTCPSTRSAGRPFHAR